MRDRISLLILLISLCILGISVKLSIDAVYIRGDDGERASRDEIERPPEIPSGGWRPTTSPTYSPSIYLPPEEQQNDGSKQFYLMGDDSWPLLALLVGILVLTVVGFMIIAYKNGQRAMAAQRKNVAEAIRKAAESTPTAEEFKPQTTM